MRSKRPAARLPIDWGLLKPTGLTVGQLGRKRATLSLALCDAAEAPVMQQSRLAREALRNSGLDLTSTAIWGRLVAHYLRLEGGVSFVARLFDAIHQETTFEAVLPGGIINKIVFRLPQDQRIALLSACEQPLRHDILFQRVQHDFASVRDLMADLSFPVENAKRFITYLGKEKAQASGKQLLEVLPRERAGKILSTSGPSEYLIGVLSQLSAAVWAEIEAEIDAEMLTTYVYRRVK